MRANGGGLAEVGLHFIQVRQQPTAVAVVDLAVAGGAHATGGPLQQLGAQARFQPLDRMGDGGARQVEVVRGGGEAAQLDDARIQAHGFDAIHDCLFPWNGVGHY
jgi:hypothetical protein